MYGTHTPEGHTFWWSLFQEEKILADAFCKKWSNIGWFQYCLHPCCYWPYGDSQNPCGNTETNWYMAPLWMQQSQPLWLTFISMFIITKTSTNKIITMPSLTTAIFYTAFFVMSYDYLKCWLCSVKNVRYILTVGMWMIDIS
jgi:hypothetical protein